MLLKIDLWVIGKVGKVFMHLHRYFNKPGRHRTNGMSTAMFVRALHQ